MINTDQDKRTFIGLITRNVFLRSIMDTHVHSCNTYASFHDTQCRWFKSTMNMLLVSIISRKKSFDQSSFRMVIVINIVEASNSRKWYNISTFKKKKKTRYDPIHVIEQNICHNDLISNKCKNRSTVKRIYAHPTIS